MDKSSHNHFTEGGGIIMKILEQTMQTTALCSEDGTHRYRLRKCWQGKGEKLKNASIIMAFPCSCGIDSMDLTTLIVVNCLKKQGYNAVDVLNLYSKISDKIDKEPDSAHTEANNNAILESCKEAENVILAWGSGYVNNKRVRMRQGEVLRLLLPMKSKVLATEKCQHPLTPDLRNDLRLQKFDFAEVEILPSLGQEAPAKKKGKRATDKAVQTAADNAMEETKEELEQNQPLVDSH